MFNTPSFHMPDFLCKKFKKWKAFKLEIKTWNYSEMWYKEELNLLFTKHRAKKVLDFYCPLIN